MLTHGKTERHSRLASRAIWARLVIAAFFLTVGFLTGPLDGVLAQVNTTLLVRPETGVIPLNNQQVFDLLLSDAVNVNAFDVIVEYDSAILRLDGWANGGFLSNLAVVVKTDNPGYFRLVCTQLATPPVSGNGTLIRLSFTGIGIGRTDIALTKGELADAQGNKTNAILGGARIDVSNQVTVTATLTATATLPATATPTATPTATATTAFTQPPAVNTPTATATATQVVFPGASPSPSHSVPTGPPNPYPGQIPTAVIPPFPTQPPAQTPASTTTPFPGAPEPTQFFPPNSGEQENTPLSPAATGLPVSNRPLRNADEASVWQEQPAKGADPLWIILGVELVVLLVLVIMLIWRRRS